MKGGGMQTTFRGAFDRTGEKIQMLAAKVVRNFFAKVQLKEDCRHPL
jgi:hypothetical protein